MKEHESLLTLRKKGAEIAHAGSSSYRYGLGISTQFDLDIRAIPKQTSYTIDIEGDARVEDVAHLPEIPITNHLQGICHAIRNAQTKIVIPDNKTATITISLTGKLASGLVLIQAGSKSNVTIVENIEGSATFRGSIVHINAKEGSSVQYATVQKLQTGKYYQQHHALAENGARVEWLDIAVGSELMKSDTTTNLAGDGSQTRVYTAAFGSDEQVFDFSTLCNHLGKNTTSFMQAHGVLKDKARHLQNNNGKIGKHATGASSHQTAQDVFLNEGPKALPIPKLEIDNNDVAATHSASVGKIDKEKLFYIQSRGLSEREAQHMYVEGLFTPFVEKLPGSMRENTLLLLMEKMPRD